ncbi:hypothetical protein FYJ88_03745 [Corynebacterium urealyticum]|uniref:hypothetical protein n=1 Tax=Corynebacterium urealyticum TaxID=43771 RepID=UPI0011E7998F|nr:hypothetical protein [Corynebacterium urealyticum]TYR17950.1 hypothetical protein FYJ88_03745 [Corynebacterium urealyticum]
MTELVPLLARLDGHLRHLQIELWEDKYHCAKTSQTGVRANTTGPSSPTNDLTLDYVVDVQLRLRELCTNAADDLAQPVPTGTTVGGFWVRWLGQQAGSLTQLEWYDDLVQELVDLEAELRHRIHPQDPHEVKLPDYATAEEIGKALGKTAEAVRKWCIRRGVTAYIIDRKTVYRTCEIEV